jgi:phosphate:Na+ symporter
MIPMPLSTICEAFGGLGLFILGMKSMSEGLQKLTGERLRNFLEKITGNRFTAALMGSCLASLLQSSSAASILVIGFVNAGLISFYQALAVLLGTGIGSTIVIQFIAFKVFSFALPSIFFGVLLKFFGRRRRLVYVGNLLIGAGLVFLGLQIMENGLAPVSQNALISGLHSHFFSWRISAVLLGALITFLIQSNSAATGIVIALASSGLLGFEVGVAMIIGEVLGTSIITIVATINGTLAAKRTALVNLLINIVSVILALLLFPFLLNAVAYLSPGNAEFIVSSANQAVPSLAQATRPYIARHLANAHTIFNVMSAILFLPFIGFFARSADLIMPGGKDSVDIEPRPKYIDHRVIDTPPIALLQVRSELKRMAIIARSMFNDTVEQFFRYDARRSTRIKQKEEVLDVLQRDITGFLVQLSRRPLSSENSMEIPIMLQAVSNLEHLGDQTEAISDYLHNKKEGKILFSNAAMSELKSLAAMVSEVVDLAVDSMGNVSEETLRNAQILKDSTRHSFNKIAEYTSNIIEAEKELSDAISFSSD